VYDLVEAFEWETERPGSLAWAVATWLQSTGSALPWSARLVLGRDPLV